MTCFIDARDVMEYRPIIPTQATLELIRVHYQDAPISGILLLSIKKGYELTKEACPKECGFNFIFTKIGEENEKT